MKSEERKDVRRKRRENARKIKRIESNKEYDNYDNVIKSSSLFNAALLSRRTVRWKGSVQRFCGGLLRNVWSLHRDLVNLKDITMGFITFKICDRGRERVIRSVHFRERVVQRSVCDNALIPVLAKSLIYDNGASLKGKGIHFHIDRCKHHLQKFYRENGFSNNGYVLLIDFAGYFDNIEHEPLIEMLKCFFSDEKLIDLIMCFINRFGNKSLGIGSQVSQILAIFYASKADHFAKEILRCHYYGRYMDDTYMIHRDKFALESNLKRMSEIYSSLGIRVNMRKTKIIPISHFDFLKVRFTLTENGKVIMRPNQKSVTKERRKLKKFKRLLEANEMTIDDIKCAYASWRGYANHLNAHKTIHSTDKLFYDLFHIWPMKKNRK